MKKSLVLTLFILALILILCIAGLCVYFLCFHRPAEAETEPSTLSVASYAAQQWPDYAADYSGGVLTLTRQIDMTYEEACLRGSEIYADELAPETYLPLVQTIALDVAATCDETPTVLLRYCSADGQTVFSVSSSGEISTCWSEGGVQ